jgi:hypothetical protein
VLLRKMSAGSGVQQAVVAVAGGLVLVHREHRRGS